jgi:hypothetical protein
MEKIEPMPSPQTDRIFPSTRIIAAAIIPFLLLAFVILYFFPQLSGQRFAWQIQPNVMAVYIGAGYLGGAYLFVRALFGRRWHHVAAGFPAVATFTVGMLLATVLHWSRFDLRHFPFQLWLGLYIITPILVPWLWLHNRPADPGTPEAHEVFVPAAVRWGARLLGLGLLTIAVVSFVIPQVLIAVWPWPLTPLLARVLAGWGALIGVGNLVIAGERRWSAWRVAVESIGLWHLLFLAGAIFHAQDFTRGNLFNWYVLSVIAVLISMAALYLFMELQRRQSTTPPRPAA